MKKIYLFVAVACATVFSSCSSDDDSNDSANSNAPVVVTIDGQKKYFEEVDVEVNGSRIYVTALTKDHADVLSFEAQVPYTGEESIYDLEYKKGNNTYYESYENNDEGIIDNVEICTEHKLKGTFHGNVVSYQGETLDFITMTNGSFDLVY
ncbi:hypothetical protein GCM10007424_08360 [Flavobacterium suaedae]|uniref:Uncharacterized protein n=1 Tax=Flavobacterium suaedae TaxID=1767027 RepID=A0ABQ1JNJ7_9FLAO|nr:hypothetical protein [Flavobacterium suaedae]GGB70715.1 hypothetical protein GCM10007424_08360 [Flavobacterium suaedae]